MSKSTQCGLCPTGPCQDSDHGWCDLHGVWYRDNGGRFVFDPHICYPGMPDSQEYCDAPGLHH